MNANELIERLKQVEDKERRISILVETPTKEIYYEVVDVDTRNGGCIDIKKTSSWKK